MHASSIRLDSTAALIVLAVLAVLAVVAVPWFWDAWRSKRVGRSATTLLAVLLVLTSSGLAVNKVGGFFPTLGSLLGTSANPGEGTDGEAGADGSGLARLAEANRQRASEGKGSTVHLTVKGGRTGIDRDVNVYLPAAYADPAWQNRSFPVIEWIPNYPSGPEVATNGYHLPEALDAAIAGNRLPPTVVLMPDPSGQPRINHDSECVDEVNGTANDTYLSADIRNWAVRTLRVSPDRRSWSIAGWSSGGYCAMNLAARHPQWYSSAVSVSGYDKAQVDVETGDLFKGRGDIGDANTVSVNLHRFPAPLDILAIAGEHEGTELAAIGTIRSALLPPTTLSSWTIPDAGHNMNTLKSQLAAVLDWLGAHSATPALAPDPRLATTGGVRPWPLPATGTPGALTGTEE
ncbi:alpha/beta hydrolase [Amycolatopsis nigrescens]|uniref:alpha/beta hydrolase n=1 Tax=Amycolatopsis nigrescens TaxID=381445 RepID=UPI0004760173|nr:alpha/beta hydrolase-fold protein [Amycolatopsis nigrescens]